MIQTILSIFWNNEESRLRAFWRIAITGSVYLLLIGMLTLGVVGIAYVFFSVPIEGLEENGPVLTALAATSLPLALGITWLAGRFLDRRRFADFGFHFNLNWWIDLGFGLALGAVLMGLIFAIEAGAGWVTITGTLRGSIPGPSTFPPALSFGIAILLAAIQYLCVGIYEELLFRGYLLRNTAEGLKIGPRGAIVIATIFSSVIFGLAHATNPSATIVSTVHIVIAGVFLALGYLLTGELAIPIGLHITWNFFQGHVFGFPVSGTGKGRATLIAIAQGGNDTITGGQFGPEAGLIGLVALALGSILITLWVHLRYGRVSLCKKLTTPDLRHRQEKAPGDKAQRTALTTDPET